MAALDVEDNALAGTIAFYSIIHIERGRVPAVLREFRRAIKPGGEVVLAVHQRDELVSLLGEAGLHVAEATQRVRYEWEATERLYVRALVP
jgi:hypothetical protein